MRNKIEKRIFHKITLELTEPMYFSQQDFQKEKVQQMVGDSVGYIPGSTVKGALSAYSKLPLAGTDQFCVYDAKTLRVTGIEQSNNWITISKGSEISFDVQEIIYKTNHFVKNDGTDYFLSDKAAEQRIEEYFKNLVSGINEGLVQFGGKKTQNYGKAKVTDVRTLVFSKENVDEWIAFNRTNDEVWK